ncbi:hypothetical protein SKAU_G00203680 [Synaphobranchus kaupii]|uniref:Uncharacterized protein n=1 Tax=Synaphobranchus kaupii TaxID=118154 RepID=A0A9Q1FG00_SYNKA|nr:hypothetical protein SKAU_G00203680 [Synaphobranchus kaupii]
MEKPPYNIATSSGDRAEEHKPRSRTPLQLPDPLPPKYQPSQNISCKDTNVNIVDWKLASLSQTDRPISGLFQGGGGVLPVAHVGKMKMFMERRRCSSLLKVDSGGYPPEKGKQTVHYLRRRQPDTHTDTPPHLQSIATRAPRPSRGRYAV